MTIEDELSRLFRAEREVQPPPGALGAGWDRLAVDLAASAPALPVASGPLKMALGIVPKWLVGGFAVGLMAASGAALVTPSAPPTADTRAPVVAAAARAQQQTAHPEDDTAASANRFEVAPFSAPIEVASARAAGAGSRGVSAPSASVDNTFDAELGLITLAKAELDRGRLAGARAALLRHAELFPTGAFAIERDALSMVAQCQAGPKNPGLSERFTALHPGSPLVQRVERACAVHTPNAHFPELPNGSAQPRAPMIEPQGGTRR
ncbi:MAG TPA: hypothetical protein VGJ91_24465 [Polyangiaceae bacterium]